jgi:hypothetical protein
MANGKSWANRSRNILSSSVFSFGFQNMPTKSFVFIHD